MEIPEGYKTLDTFEVAQKKYYEWDFKNRKKNELKKLYYKGIYTADPYNNPEECVIVGYYDDTWLIIELLKSKEKVIIHHNYLKQMQDKNFRQNQIEHSDESDDIEYQGKQLDVLPDDYIVYDIETSGRSYNNDEIIEIAAVKVKEGKIVDTFQSLICQEFELNKNITRLTGITNDMLSKAPSVDVVIPLFKDFVGNSILVGHNIQTFDNWFLHHAYLKCNLGSLFNDYVDTLPLARKAIPELSHHKIIDIVEFFNIEQDEDFHRALNDCYYNQQCYELIKKKIFDEYGSINKYNLSHVLTNPKKETTNQTRSSNLYPKHADLRKIEASSTEFNANNPFYEKSCVFTGELLKYSREEAAQIIVNLGGKCENNVTKKTNYLIVSATSDPTKKSGKQKKAEEYMLRGQDIEILPESVFYEMIKDE